MKKLLLLSLVCFISGIMLPAQEKNFLPTSDGVIVYPANAGSSYIKAVRLKIYNDHIIRVTASPSMNFAADASLVVTMQPVVPPFSVKQEGEIVELKLRALSAKVNLQEGTVSFYAADGKQLLQEMSGTRLAEPVIEEGQPLYRLTRHFLSTADDAYYGLGQHQDDSWNYKGKKTIFFQNNTEVAVPFLMSLKNYGLLWDNYSYSEAGDIRPELQLNTLKLEDKYGQPGWLTATYYNDKTKSDKLFEKAESEIWYPYMNDLLQRAPAAFKPATGRINWEGSIAADIQGVYTFRFTYGGYFRLYINGKLLADKWRQSWNPGTALVQLPVEAGKKYTLRIDWEPDGGESYISARYLPPPGPEEQNSFSFRSEAGKQADYYFVKGDSPDQVIKGYRELTGKAPIVPRWAMGFWQSRERYKSQDEILNTVAEFRKRKIPLDNIVQDWFYWKENDWGSQEFDPARFPAPDSLISELHKKYKVQLMISVWPKIYEGITTYKEFNQNGWLYTRNIADRQKDWVGPGYVSTFYDVFNEKARKAFWELLRDKLFSKKVDAWWMDASEPDIQSNVSPEKRKQQMQPLALGTAAEYMNAYPLMNAKGIYEGQRGTDNNKRVFLLTRSAFAGSQRYAASIWSGDIGARWEDMRTQITAGMNYSMSGLPYWTMDIGGFATENKYNNTPMKEEDEKEWRELQTRWYQWGSFLPLFRSHGQFPFRESFNIAPESHPAFQSMLYYNQLRYRLLPYYYSLAGQAYHNDYTIMRGLVMDFSADKQTWSVSDQFMTGPSFMISPVYTYGATERKIYLPGGQGWYELYSGIYTEGGKVITASAPYERVPVYIKAGSVIPTGPAIQYSTEKPADPIIIYVYAGKDGRFSLYEDEGINYNYEKGLFSEIPMSWNETDQTLTIGERTGSFPGMMQKRTFRVILVSKDKPSPMNFNLQSGKQVKYSGKKIIVHF